MADTLTTNLSDNNARKIGIRAKNFSPLRTQRMMVCRNGEFHNDDIVGAKNFSPSRTQRMMVCRDGEFHNDDIVGAGFARPYHRCRPHHRPNGELHNGDMVVGAKNFSPPRRLGCDDNHKMDCFAALAMTDAVVIDAYNLAQAFMDCFAALAMTDAVVIDANVSQTIVNKPSTTNDTRLMDCFAALANASSTESMTDAVVFADNQTSFLPNFDNKTTSVAGECTYNQPHYLIKTHYKHGNNEVMRLSGMCCLRATEVVLSGKLGKDEVFSDADDWTTTMSNEYRTRRDARPCVSTTTGTTTIVPRDARPCVSTATCGTAKNKNNNKKYKNIIKV
jgi:hypothetical protein